MKKVILAQVKPYQAPKHFNMVPLRLHGKEETGAQKFSVGLSHFLPGGGAEYDSSPAEKFYFVLEGEITVKTKKLFKLACGVLLAGAGDDAVLNEARIFIERRVEESRSQTPSMKLFDIVEITCGVVNELVSYYRDKVEESFGYVLAGLENISSGNAKLYTIFGAGFSDIPWACIGSGSSYARPFVDLLLSQSDLVVEDAVKTMPVLFTLVSNVQSNSLAIRTYAIELSSVYDPAPSF